MIRTLLLRIKNSSSLFFLLIFFISSSYLFSQKRTLLVENPMRTNGTSSLTPALWNIDSVAGLYPNDVILVRPHFDKNMRIYYWNNDELDLMGIPESSILCYYLNSNESILGFLNRKKYENSKGKMEFPIPRDLYPYVQEEINKPAKVGLNVEWAIEPETRTILAKINAFMFETINKPLRFNLYVVEDSLSGKGFGWDLYNIISGDTSWLPCPYVDMPDTIKGYVHRHVARAMPAGTFGVQGTFQNPAVQNEIYEQCFNIKIKDEWDVNKLSIVGFINVFDPDNDDYEVLNSARGIKEKSEFNVKAKNNNTAFVNKSGTYEKTFTIKNRSNESKVFQLNINRSINIPENWILDIGNGNSISLNAGESTEVKINVNTSDNLGAGDIILEVSEKDNPLSFIWKEPVSIYSKEIQKVNVMDEFNFEEYSLKPMIYSLNRIDYFDIPRDIYINHVSEFHNRKILIWNTGHFVGCLDSIEVAKLNEEFDSNINIFLVSRQDPMLRMKHYNMDSKFGFEYKCLSLNNPPYFTGYEDDDVSDFLFSTTNSYKPIIWYIQVYSILNDSIVSPLLRLTEDGNGSYLDDDGNYVTIPLPADSAIFSLKVDNGKNRMVFMQRNPLRFASQDTARILVDNILKWLEGPVNVDDYEVHNKEFYLSAQPNPASNVAIIKYAYDGILPKHIEISLYDITGNKIKTYYKGQINPGEYSTELNTSFLASGSYRIVLGSGGDVISHPVVLIK